MKNGSIKTFTGFTLIEIIFVITIISLIAVGISTYVSQGARLWNTTLDKIEAQENVRAALNSMMSEMREMLPADNGSYPLILAQNLSIEFYSNIDEDTDREKIKYELIDGTLYKWVVNSDGAEPPQYPNFSPDDRTLITENIINQDKIFSYYDNTYNGETEPMTQPFDLNDVSLIQVSLNIDPNQDNPPEAFNIVTSVSLRNLKYKYDN